MLAFNKSDLQFGERIGGKNMANLKNTGSKGASVLSVAAIVLCAMTAVAQSARDKCRPASVIPVANEPPAKILIDPPLAEPLASRGVVVIEYCAENLHIVPVFGPSALAVSPRVGHLHVSVDDASWRWADASGNPIILMGLSPGPHKALLELEDANHHTLDKGTVTFVIPEKFAAPKPRQTDGEAAPIFGVKSPLGYRDWRLISAGAWGFAQFNDGKPADMAVHNTCFSCQGPSKLATLFSPVTHHNR
jgi:hypothetical protein